MSLSQHHVNIYDEEGREIRIDMLLLKKADIVIRTLNHPLRARIIKILAGQKELTVTQIFETLQVEQSVISQHLAMLRRAGMVVTSRTGKYIRYKLKTDRIQELLHLAKQIVQTM
jgi:ArsR family transcriptional regulator, virulence genes transcriptional regulator